jgi:hypothetical protein
MFLCAALALLSALSAWLMIDGQAGAAQPDGPRGGAAEAA